MFTLARTETSRAICRLLRRHDTHRWPRPAGPRPRATNSWARQTPSTQYGTRRTVVAALLREFNQPFGSLEALFGGASRTGGRTTRRAGRWHRRRRSRTETARGAAPARCSYPTRAFRARQGGAARRGGCVPTAETPRGSERDGQFGSSRSCCGGAPGPSV